MLAAGALALGLTAFFWLPAATEGGAVQLEWLHDGDLRYDDWLLDPAGNTRRQQSPYNRQTREGLVDLHLLYPHQLVAAPKLSLAQTGGALLALGALASGAALGARPPAPAPAAPPAPPGPLGRDARPGPWPPWRRCCLSGSWPSSAGG